jgi:hypothetical protein
MSKIALSGPAGGTATYTVTAPTGATDQVITLPDNTGTLISTASTFAGTGPAFSAYQSSAQSLTATVSTKIQLQSEEFDTNSNFDSTTNYRFTPTVAGYYQLNAGLLFNTSSAASNLFTAIWKNGSEYKRGVTLGGGSITNPVSTVATVVYANGSTDYFELYANSSAGVNTLNGIPYTYFNGAMVRAA